MRIYDIIQKKKNGLPLTPEEIKFAVEGFTKGEIPDYQMSALLMAICLRGMDSRETANLTMAMAYSGETVDLSPIAGVKVDKHSTGGVGDKTTLVISPIVASCGVPIAKMSGRGLGHTGGTVDKLESIPGLRTDFSRDEFLGIVESAGICVAGQSGNLAPADKKIYALRDVTATIDSIPLIAASIMSKKIAAGADCILLDVKTGKGAFMKTLEDSRTLAKAMVEIGESVGRKTVALITDMDNPLGNAIGNSLEIVESVEALKMSGPSDLTEVCVALAAEMLDLAGKVDCRKLAVDALSSGRAFETFKKMVAAQGGDANYIEKTECFKKAPLKREVLSASDGYIERMDAEACGIACAELGAGRKKAGDAIDSSAGMYLRKKPGDAVRVGDCIAELYGSDREGLAEAERIFLSGVGVSLEKPVERPLILEKITNSNLQ